MTEKETGRERDRERERGRETRETGRERETRERQGEIGKSLVKSHCHLKSICNLISRPAHLYFLILDIHHMDPVPVAHP